MATSLRLEFRYPMLLPGATAALSGPSSSPLDRPFDVAHPAFGLRDVEVEFTDEKVKWELVSDSAGVYLLISPAVCQWFRSNTQDVLFYYERVFYPDVNENLRAIVDFSQEIDRTAFTFKWT